MTKAKSESSTQNDSIYKNFVFLCFNGNINQVKRVLQLPRLDIRSLLTFVDPEVKVTPLFAAIGRANPNPEVVKEILNAVKNDKELLREIFIQTTNPMPPFCLAANPGNARNPEKVKVFKEVLNAVKDDKELLREILMQTDNNGESPLYIATKFINTEVVKEILNTVRDDQRLLREILTQTNPERKSALLIASSEGEIEMIKEILSTVEDNSALFSEIVRQKPNYVNLSIPTHLNMIGNDEIMALVFKNVPDIEIDKLPAGYYSSNSLNPLYYIDALTHKFDNTKSLQSQLYQENEYDSLQEVNINNANAAKSTLIVIEEANKIILAPVIQQNSGGKILDKSNISKAIEMAKRHNVNKIVQEVNTHHYNGLGSHSMVIALSRVDAKSKWKTNIYDSNVLQYNQLPGVSDFVINLAKEIAKDVYEGGQFRVSKNPIIRNYAGSSEMKGFCDIISSIVIAAIITKQEQNVRDYCQEQGKSCVETLARELHEGGVNEVLQKKFNTFKGKYSIYGLVEYSNPQMSDMRTQNANHSVGS